MKIIADTNIPFVSDCFQHIGEVKVIAGREITADTVKDADILLVRSITKVNAELLEGSSVKFVATATIGVDHIDREYLTEKGIGFASAPGSNANSVAEYITAAMLEIAEKYEFELAGKTIGIIGVGNVGSRVEKKAQALGMQVVLNDPPLQRETQDKKYRPIEELYDCDFITIHTPLTKDGQDPTYHLAEDNFFNRLKEGVIVMNSSRGPVVACQSITEALLNGKVKTAVLDVWENEPVVEIDLLNMVSIATPHIAGYSYDGKVAGMTMIYEACCKHFGIEPVNTAADFVPAPIIPMIDVSSMKGTDQRKLREIVSKLYYICADDTETRRIESIEPNERGAYFDALRKGYPIRREFYNTTITGAKGRLKETLAGLGFLMK